MIFGLFDEWESNRKDSPYNCSPPSVSCPFSIEVANIEIMNCQKHKKYGMIGLRDPWTRNGKFVPVKFSDQVGPGPMKTKKNTNTPVQIRGSLGPINYWQ